MSTFIETLRREAQALAQQVATLRPERVRLASADAAAEAGYSAALASVTHGVPSDLADAAHTALQAARQSLARVESTLADVEARHADLYRLLSADESAAAVAETVRTAGLAVVALHGKLDANTEAVGRLAAMQATEATAAQAARAALAARAVGELPEEVRALIGATATEPGAVAADPAPHDQRAAALGGALVTLASIGAALQADLDVAVTVHSAAIQAQREHQACIAELQHAQALSEYLPALMQFRNAHHAAFDDMPSMPNLRAICQEWREPVEVTAQPEDGLVKRGLKRLASAAGF